MVFHEKYLILLYGLFSLHLTLCKDCGDGIIRGVNLGGWLLMEPWITPTIFEEVNIGELENKIVDEYTYAQYVDKDFAAQRLDRHWDDFYKKENLITLSDAGITHLRIPIGYWLVDVLESEPFPTPPTNDDEGQRFYLKRLLGWAQDLKLKVMFDLHGAPGSQNGYDNSGRRGGPENKDGIHFLEDDNVNRTIKVLELVTQMISGWIIEEHISMDTVFGIELANEPWGLEENPLGAELWRTCRDEFYPSSYNMIRSTFPENSPLVVLQNGFRDFEDFHGYMENNTGVHVDWHVYQCFGGWNAMADLPGKGWSEHLDEMCQWGDPDRTLPMSIGEWSLAVTDCQKYLRYPGYNDPYDHDASSKACEYYNGDFPNYPEDYKQFLRQFFLSQTQRYQTLANGWFFWTGKTENSCGGAEWDFLYLLSTGILPDLCEEPNVCN